MSFCLSPRLRPATTVSQQTACSVPGLASAGRFGTSHILGTGGNIKPANSSHYVQNRGRGLLKHPYFFRWFHLATRSRRVVRKDEGTAHMISKLFLHKLPVRHWAPLCSLVAGVGVGKSLRLWLLSGLHLRGSQPPRHWVIQSKTEMQFWSIFLQSSLRKSWRPDQWDKSQNYQIIRTRMASFLSQAFPSA